MIIYGIDFASGPDRTVIVDIVPNGRGGFAISIPAERSGKVFNLQAGNFPSVALAKHRITESPTMRLGTIHTTNPADKHNE